MFCSWAGLFQICIISISISITLIKVFLLLKQTPLFLVSGQLSKNHHGKWRKSLTTWRKVEKKRGHTQKYITVHAWEQITRQESETSLCRKCVWKKSTKTLLKLKKQLSIVELPANIVLVQSLFVISASFHLHVQQVCRTALMTVIFDLIVNWFNRTEDSVNIVASPASPRLLSTPAADKRQQR